MDLSEQMDRLEDRLRDLLAALDGARNDVHAIERACQLAAGQDAVLDSIASQRGLVPAEVRSGVDERLRRLAALNAVAVDAARTEHARMQADLQRVLHARALQAQGAANVAGGSCDVSG